MSQPEQQAITIHKLPNISQQAKYFSSKIMQKMRYRNQFQTSFCFQKALYEVKANSLYTQFQYISIALKLAYNKKKLYKGLITNNDILKIYRIIKYFKDISKRNMVKNIFKIKKRSYFYSKKIQFDFIHFIIQKLFFE